MKKKLRFLLPHEPLKVLRGEPDEEDEQDELFRRFQPPPGTTTEEEENDINATDDEDTTDIDDDDDDRGGIYPGNRHVPRDNADYDTTGSAIQEAAPVEAVAQIHHRPDLSDTDGINGCQTGGDDFSTEHFNSRQDVVEYYGTPSAHATPLQVLPPNNDVIDNEDDALLSNDTDALLPNV